VCGEGSCTSSDTCWSHLASCCSSFPPSSLSASMSPSLRISWTCTIVSPEECYAISCPRILIAMLGFELPDVVEYDALFSSEMFIHVNARVTVDFLVEMHFHVLYRYSFFFASFPERNLEES
jgi:hypothetical protein